METPAEYKVDRLNKFYTSVDILINQLKTGFSSVEIQDRGEILCRFLYSGPLRFDGMIDIDEIKRRVKHHGFDFGYYTYCVTKTVRETARDKLIPEKARGTEVTIQITGL